MGQSYTVLVVDDSPFVFKAVKKALEPEGFQFMDQAFNGQECLERIAQQIPDLIILDITMPVMDGLKFMRIARQRGHEQPIIFFTGHGTEQLKREVEAMGAADLLMKPNFLTLELSIRKHMNSSESHSF